MNTRRKADEIRWSEYLAAVYTAALIGASCISLSSPYVLLYVVAVAFVIDVLTWTSELHPYFYTRKSEERFRREFILMIVGADILGCGLVIAFRGILG